MLISRSLEQHLVPRIHNMSQVDSILIFDENESQNEELIKTWPKIKGIFTELGAILDTLEQAVDQCEQNVISISFAAINGDTTNQDLNQLHLLFMYSQILKETLLTIDFKEKDIKKFMEYCRDVFVENDAELRNIDKFEKEYDNKTPIWWYIYDYFLRPMVSRALQLMDMDIIIKIGFFVHDLHHHIEQLHSKQFKEDRSSRIFTVYRGQGMTKTDFKQLTKLKGGLISFNNFLTTSNDRKISLDLAQGVMHNPDLVGVLFVMTIDPSISTTPFAFIIDVSYCQDAKEKVLFSIQTVFRISDIKQIGENNRLFQVDLTLTNDIDNELRVLGDHLREKILPGSSGRHRLGLLLQRMGHSNTAQEVYKDILKQTTAENENGFLYEQLAEAKCTQGEYKEAIKFYEKALEIQQQSLPSNHPALSMTYGNIGTVYDSIGEYSKALSFYERVVEVAKFALSPNDPNLQKWQKNVEDAKKKL